MKSVYLKDKVFLNFIKSSLLVFKKNLSFIKVNSKNCDPII